MVRVWTKEGGLSFLAAPFGIGGVLRDSPENDAFALGASATLQYAMRKGARAFFGIRYMRATASPENLGLLSLGLSIPF